jgi:hypothetical protein
MDKKLNPLQMVVREMSEHGDLDRDTLEIALTGLLMHLQSRARTQIDLNADSVEACEAAIQYRAVCEMIAVFGTQLIAFEDMDDELPTGDRN